MDRHSEEAKIPINEELPKPRFVLGLVLGLTALVAMGIALKAGGDGFDFWSLALVGTVLSVAGIWTRVEVKRVARRPHSTGSMIRVNARRIELPQRAIRRRTPANPVDTKALVLDWSSVARWRMRVYGEENECIIDLKNGTRIALDCNWVLLESSRLALADALARFAGHLGHRED